MTKLSPLPQEYYDENRDLYGAETSFADLSLPEKCEHYFKRIGAYIECDRCPFGLHDPQFEFKIIDGKINAELD